MRLHGRLWRRVAISTLLLLTCLPATLAPDPPPIDPARILEQLDEASSELVPSFSPSHRFPSGIPGITQEGPSSSDISRAVGSKRGGKRKIRPPSGLVGHNNVHYRIEMHDKLLVDGLMEAIRKRAEHISLKPNQRRYLKPNLDRIAFKSARDLLESSGQPGEELKAQVAGVVSTSTATRHRPVAPIVDRYYVGDVVYFMQRHAVLEEEKLHVFNVVATIGRGTKSKDRVFLGRLSLPSWLVKTSRNEPQGEDLPAAQRAAVEPVRVHPANLVPGGVGQALQHNEAGRGAEHLRPLVRHNERPRLDPEERPPFDLNEIPHEHESGDEA